MHIYIFLFVCTGMYCTAKSIYELNTQKTGNHRNTFDGTVIQICVTFTFCQSAQEWGHNASFANEYLKNAYS